MAVGRDGRAVAHDVGLLLFVPAGIGVATVPVAILVGEARSALPPALAAVCCVALGTWLVRRYADARALHRWPAIEVVALGWLSCALVGAAVLWGIGTIAPEASADAIFASPVDALFEATSGITSTGLTVADGRESSLSRTVQWWRSILQWVGGIGVVLFAAGFGHTAAQVSALYGAEGRSDDFGGDVRHTVRAIMALYAVFTLLALGAFLLTEQTPWAALNHAMTGIATGGFTVTDDSFAGYGTGTQLVALAIITIGAISFVAHHLLVVERDLHAWWRFTPTRAQTAWWAVGLGSMLWVGLLLREDLGAVDLVFQFVSAAGTAGFATHEDLAGFGPLLLVVLVVAMVVGAPSGSTGGGLKLDRPVWLCKDLVSRLRGGADAPAPLSWDGGPVEPDVRHRSVRHAGQMLGLWLCTLLAGTAALSWASGRFEWAVLFDAASALSNVGLDAGVVNGELASAGKLVVIGLMYLGRLELLAALILASQREHIDER